MLANAVLDNGGAVTGIMPSILQQQEHLHLALTRTIIVPDMHARKKLMYEKSDAAIILPGGFGTLDEFFEILTWNNLKLHHKKIFLLNSAGFYTQLLLQLNAMHSSGFLYSPPADQYCILQSPHELLQHL